MRFSRVPVNMYKKFFIIMLCVFFGAFLLEFITAMLGHPFNNISFEGINVDQGTPLSWLLMSIATAFLCGGIANFFCTVRIIKEMLRLNHWPAFIVVLMTLFFLIEIILGVLLFIPNVIIFGLKGRVKNRTYEVDF